MKLNIVLEDEWVQLLNRISARAGKSTTETIKAALQNLDAIQCMELGDQVLITKHSNDSDVTVERLLKD